MVPKIEFDKYQKNGAYHWEWLVSSYRPWYKECVEKCVDFCKGSTIDVGCGDGVVSAKVREKGLDVLGIDADPAAIGWATHLCPHVNRFAVVDINEPINLLAPFEYAVCLNTIEHLQKLDGLMHLLRCNIKKGAIIITDEKTNKLGRYHVREYTQDELLDMFKEFNPKPFRIDSTEFGKPVSFVGVEILKPS